MPMIALLFWMPAIVLGSYLAATALVAVFPWLALALAALIGFLVLGAWATK